jgi:hypothetical protein
MEKHFNFERIESTHACMVYPVDGTPYERVKGNITTPVPWTHTWWVHDENTWDEPETTFMKRSLTPERIHDGQYSLRMFASFRAVHCGLVGQVAVKDGDLFRLSAFAHAWTNHKEEDMIPGHEDCVGDPHCSWGAGRGAFASKIDDLPPLNGNAWNDALHAATFRVGIDPAGGMDPTSPSVVWSDGWAIYNIFHELSVVARAKANRISIFLSQKMRWHFRNNDGYWDTVTLMNVQNGDEPVDYYPPAFPYKKVGLVVHPQASFATGAAVGIVARHPNAKRSNFQSMEDACQGPPENRLYFLDWPDEQKDDYVEYVDEFYPHVEMSFIDGKTPTEVAVKALPPLASDIALGQTDERWADKFFGEDPREKIEAYGCFVTAAAVGIRQIYQVDMMPDLLDQLLVNARVAYVEGNLIYWEGFCSLFDKFEDPIKDNDVRTARELADLLETHFVILRRHDGGHFVVLERVEGTDLHIIDTYDGKRRIWMTADHAGVRAARVPGQEPPSPPPPPPPPPSNPRVLMGAQQQRTGTYRDEYIARVKPPMWLLLEGYEQAQHIKSLSPETKVAIRFVDDDPFGYIYSEDLDAAATRFGNKFRDSLERNAEWIDYVLGLNEYIATNDYKALRASSDWVQAYCAWLDRINNPAKPICFNAGVGNPQHNWICDEQGIERQIPLMVPGARALMYADGAFGHHAYHGVRWQDDFCTLYESDPGGTPLPVHFSMRSLLSIDPVFVAHGVKVNHVITEMGAIYYDPIHGMCNAGAGFKYKDALNGDIDAYVKQLVDLNRLYHNWNQQHDNRLLASIIFLWAGYSMWDKFAVEGEMGKKLADAFVAIQE